MKQLNRFKELLAYNPDTGQFRRCITVADNAKVDSVAGYVDFRGYRTIMIDGKRYRAGRLAWLFVHGKWPKPEIDHINRDRSDDRIGNLREATKHQNRRNLAPNDLPCGIRRFRGRYQARTQTNGKRHCSRPMPTVTFALLWLAALRAKYDPASEAI